MNKHLRCKDQRGPTLGWAHSLMAGGDTGSRRKAVATHTAPTPAPNGKMVTTTPHPLDKTILIVLLRMTSGFQLEVEVPGALRLLGPREGGDWGPRVQDPGVLQLPLDSGVEGTRPEAAAPVVEQVLAPLVLVPELRPTHRLARRLCRPLPPSAPLPSLSLLGA